MTREPEKRQVSGGWSSGSSGTSSSAGGEPATWPNASIPASSWENTVPHRPAETRIVPGPCALDVPCRADRQAIPHVAIFHDLTHEQAFGHACIVCGRFFEDPKDQVPVGRSVTGDIVHACATPRTCARDLGTSVGDEPACAGLWSE